MHLSIDIIAEELAAQGHDVRIFSREDRRGIVTVTTDATNASDNMLLVVDSHESLPAVRNLLLVTADEWTDPVGDIPNLAVMHTSLTVDDVCGRLASIMLDLSGWDARMLKAIAERQSVESVLAIGAERLRNPIALFDSRQALVGYAGTLTEEAEGTIWEDVLLSRFSPVEFYTREEQEQINRLAYKRWPFVLSPARDPEHHYASSVIMVDGQAMGSTGQVDVNAPLTPGQLGIEDMVAERLQLAFSARLAGNPGEDDISYLLRSVLNGNKADHGLLAFHLAKMGLRPGEQLTLLVCHCPSEQEQLANTSRLGRIRQRIGRCVCILHEGHVVALCMGSDPCDIKGLSSLLARLDMRAVESEPFDSMVEARRAYGQCTLGLGALEDAPAGSMAHLADVFEGALTHAFDPSIDPLSLARAELVTLAEKGYRGDIERGKSLIRELYAFLMNGCNAHLTARQLYLHRNTLTYQIEQIERLLDVHLDELSHSRRLHLIVSCLVALGGDVQPGGLR